MSVVRVWKVSRQICYMYYFKMEKVYTKNCFFQRQFCKVIRKIPFQPKWGSSIPFQTIFFCLLTLVTCILLMREYWNSLNIYKIALVFRYSNYIDQNKLLTMYIYIFSFISIIFHNWRNVLSKNWRVLVKMSNFSIHLKGNIHKVFGIAVFLLRVICPWENLKSN